MMPLSKLYYEHFIPFLHRAISQATALTGVGKYFPIDSNLNHVQARRFFFFTFPSLLSFFAREKRQATDTNRTQMAEKLLKTSRIIRRTSSSPHFRTLRSLLSFSERLTVKRRKWRWKVDVKISDPHRMVCLNPMNWKIYF